MATATRIIMFGTGDFAVPTLERLIATGHNVVALVTQPDRPQGRKQERIPSRVTLCARAHAIPIEQPEDVNTGASLEQIAGYAPDLYVTAAYGQILSAALLSIPRLGGINLHGSVLPAYRGAAPVARAIQNGEVETGVTVILMTPRIDAGGMIATARTPIGSEETAGELEDRLALLGCPLIVDAVAMLAEGRATILTQDKAQVTRAPKLRKEDGVIDWTRPAQAIHDLVRAMRPWPMASTIWHPRLAGSQQPLRLIVHRTAVVDGGGGMPGEVIDATAERLVVAAGAGGVAILVVQTPGKKALAVAEFLRGHRVQPRDRMG